MSWSTKGLGGYFELELPRKKQGWLNDALKFCSARAAFASLVDQLNYQKIWLPRYLCDTMVDVLRSRAVSTRYYDLNDDFTIKDEISLDEHSIILYVNYFGVCVGQAQEIISRYGAHRVVIDNSQAFFCRPFATLATIYSPRKFFGLPDGGLLYSRHSSIRQPESRDVTSESRMGHLISRLTNSPEVAYRDYQESERAIGELPVLGMSRLTERLLLSLDLDSAFQARARNASYLARRLREHNHLSLVVDDHTAPLCYPFLPKEECATRHKLIKKRVYLPCYWPEVEARVEGGSFEWDLASKGMFLPCDQRYNEDDMAMLVRLLAIH